MLAKPNFRYSILGDKKSVINETIKINDTVIENSGTVKLLGFQIDDKLTWNYHIEKVISKLNQAKFLLESCKTCLLTDQRKLLYYSHFLSHVQYGIHLWGPLASASKLKSMFVKQKKFIRSICNSKYNAHTDPLYKDLKILKLNQLILLEVGKLSFKLIKGYLPAPLLKSFEHDANIERTYLNTRNSQNPLVKRHTSSIYNKCYLTKCIMLWQKLPNELKHKPTITSFTRSLKKYLLDNSQFAL